MNSDITILLRMLESLERHQKFFPAVPPLPEAGKLSAERTTGESGRTETTEKSFSTAGSCFLPPEME